MKNIFIILTFLLAFIFRASAQDAKAKARAFDRSISIEAGGIYSRLLGGDTYTKGASLAGGYGYFAKIHAQLRGMRYLGITLGWSWQIWEHSAKDSTQKNISTYVGGPAWTLGVKYYPFRHFYLGVEGTLNKLNLKSNPNITGITKTTQIGARISLNKEFFVASYPFEIGLAGLLMLPTNYPKIYGANLSLSTRI